MTGYIDASRANMTVTFGNPFTDPERVDLVYLFEGVRWDGGAELVTAGDYPDTQGTVVPPRRGGAGRLTGTTARSMLFVVFAVAVAVGL